MMPFMIKLKNMSLIWKLLISYILIISIPISLLAFYLYNQSVDKTKKEFEYILSSQMGQISNNLNKTAEILEIYSSSISQNNMLRKYLYFYTSTPDYDLLMFSSLAPYLNTINVLNPNIYSLHIYTMNPAVPRYQDVMFNTGNVETEDWYNRCIEMGYNEVYWETPHKEKTRDIDGLLTGYTDVEVISLYRKIYSPDGEDTLGFLEINIRTSDIFGFIQPATNHDIGVYITDEKSTPVFITNNLIGNQIGRLLHQYGKGGGSLDITVNSSGYLGIHTFVDKLSYELYILYPYSAISPSASSKFITIIIILVLIAATAFFITYFISVVIFKRMNQLIKNMKKVQEGNFDVQMKVDSMDEIGQINRAFNVMVQKIDSLIDTVYKTQLAEKEATLSYLQAQMNPHFLFNSLEAIRMMAEIGKNYKLSDALCALSDVMRAHIKLDSYVAVSEEIHIIQSYVFIQNIRYKNKIHLEINISEEILLQKIPSLILEPLVENAIVHGFRHKTGSCRIAIGSRRDESKGILQFDVEDNGTGFSSERLAEVNSILAGKTKPDDAKLEGNGISLYNINQRIKLYYSKECGIFISKKPSGENCVSVLITSEPLSL